MKIIMGDMHGRSFWKYVSQIQKFNKFIFIGDYVDTHEDILGIEQLRNLEDIIQFKKDNLDKVVLLLGNHDYQYWPGIGSICSGYQPNMNKSFEYVFNENRDLFQMAHYEDNVLFTHAGLSEKWIENICNRTKLNLKIPEFTAESLSNFINEVWKNLPHYFRFSSQGYDPYGDDIHQTPIWIRPRSLMKSSQNIKKSDIIQVVGHTSQNQIDIEGKATGGKYYFIDTLGTSGEYLIIENGKFSTNKI